MMIKISRAMESKNLCGLYLPSRHRTERFACGFDLLLEDGHQVREFMKICSRHFHTTKRPRHLRMIRVSVRAISKVDAYLRFVHQIHNKAFASLGAFVRLCLYMINIAEKYYRLQ
jgi:hypothetical protein